MSNYLMKLYNSGTKYNTMQSCINLFLTFKIMLKMQKTIVILTIGSPASPQVGKVLSVPFHQC
jgi:hypothetical protein